MRSLTVLLPLAILLAPADGSPLPGTAVQADTVPDTVRVDGRPAQTRTEDLPACPMPVSRGDHAVAMPNYAPPPPPAPPSDASPYQRLIPIPVPPTQQMRDQMPVIRSGCWNPLFTGIVPPDSLAGNFRRR